MNTPNTSAPTAATTGPAASETSIGIAAFLSRSAAVYAPSAKYAACPNETMPPNPIRRLKAVAKSATIAISISSITKNVGITCGASPSAMMPAASPPHHARDMLVAGLRPPEQAPRPYDQHDGRQRAQE